MELNLWYIYIVYHLIFLYCAVISFYKRDNDNWTGFECESGEKWTVDMLYIVNQP